MKFCQKECMKKFSLLLQIFFKLFLIFLFILIWIRYFVDSLVYSIIISAILTFIVDFFTRFFFKRKQKKLSLILKEKEDAENMFFSLAMEQNSNNFFSTLLKNKQDLTSHKDFFTFKEGEKVISLFPIFNFSPTTVNEIAKALKKTKKYKPNKIIILSGEYSKECFSFINIYDEEIILLDKYQTYEKLYKRYNTFPNVIKTKKEIKKTSIKDILSFSLNRSRVKSYLFSALALLFCSLFVKNTLYYSIVSSILLILAIISLSNPFTKQKAVKEII